MVLESLFPVRAVEKNPVDIFILSVIVSLVSIFISNSLFPEYAGIISPLLITVAMTPLIIKIFKIEEDIERKSARNHLKLNFVQRHHEVIWLFTLFFLGNLLSVFFVMIISPEAFISTAFSQQMTTIEGIAGPTGGAFLNNTVLMIIENNMKVMLLSFVLSFLFGAGALFILSWNASILGVYLGSFIRQGLYQEFAVKTIGIVPHAPIEIGAYFLAGIAGGMLSVGIIREKIKSKAFLLVFRDSLIMMGLAILAVVLGSFVEVFL